MSWRSCGGGSPYKILNSFGEDLRKKQIEKHGTLEGHRIFPWKHILI